MSGSTSGITFPSTRGLSGQVLTSDGAGLITWQDVSGSAEYFLSTTAGSIYTTGSTAFIGAESMDDFFVPTTLPSFEDPTEALLYELKWS